MQIYRHARPVAVCEKALPSAEPPASAAIWDKLDHPIQLLQGAVVAIETPVENVRIVRIRTDRPMLFAPGQYAKLRFVGGRERSYSIASVEDDDTMEFHIRIAIGEAAGSQIAQTLRVGDGLGISGPHGSSHLRHGHAGPIICVAGGTGLAPMLSIVRGALEMGLSDPVYLYYGEKSCDDVYGAVRLAELERRYTRFTSHVVIDLEPSATGWRQGPLTTALASDWHGPTALQAFRAFVSGSPAMACAVRDVLVARGLSSDRIHSDSFAAPSVVGA